MEWVNLLPPESKVALLGIFITFLVSAISLIFSLRNNKAIHYVNTVTEKRVEWISHLRSLVSQYIAMVNINDNTYFNENTKEDIENSGKHLAESRRINSEIKLYLNFSDKKDREIMDIIDRILETFRDYYYETFTCKVSKDGFFIENEKMKEISKENEMHITLLTQKIQIYLKAEWNRVKYESTGKVYENTIQRFDYKELEEKYNNNGYKDKWFQRRVLISLVFIKNLFVKLQNLILMILFIGIIVFIAKCLV